jgi:hypothetical protein
MKRRPSAEATTAARIHAKQRVPRA